MHSRIEIKSLPEIRNMEGDERYEMYEVSEKKKSSFLLEKLVIGSPARTFMVRKCFFKPAG